MRLKYIRAKELADLLGVNKSTIWRWVKRQKLTSEALHLESKKISYVHSWYLFALKTMFILNTYITSIKSYVRKAYVKVL